MFARRLREFKFDVTLIPSTAKTCLQKKEVSLVKYASRVLLPIGISFTKEQVIKNETKIHKKRKPLITLGIYQLIPFVVSFRK